jgi:2-C-methyl-D-erythritol 4-phosphate cytidylyltransferase/2-C-methyl-D-erythritol 2,4-cyclodiphosphate synthase
MICGVAVPHAVNVTAHSDGDVGLHALCDAIFGALADGDIGSHFPPSDERWRDATSDQFLAFACNRAHAVGAQISNLDVTLICEQPKITPHRDAMRTRIAEICALPVSHISVKATTSEGLGFTGRREGIAAQATATLLLPVIQEGSSKS